MYATFQELYTEIYTQLEQTATSLDDTEKTSIKLRLNAVQDWITFYKNWDWRQKTYYFTLRTPYTTGTITLTQNSKTVTGSSTAWDGTVKRGYLVYGGKSYKIQAVASTTSLTLEAPFDGASVSGATYSIVFPDYFLNHEITNVSSVKINGEEIEIKDLNRLLQTVAGTGQPTEVAFGRRTSEDYFNTGTIAVTNGSATITLTGGEDWPSDIEGMSFRVNDFSKLYTIKTRSSATVAILSEAYEGSTASGKAFAVAPKGTQMITFRCSPNDYYFIEMDCLVRSPKLVSDTAYSFIPDHAPLLHGAIWLCLTDFENKNPVRIQQARADFEKSLKQLEMTWGVSNKKWQSADENFLRKTGLSNFNPLRDNIYGL